MSPPAALVAWVAVWIFWLTTTRGFHPTFGLAVIVTTSLVVAFATAVTLNHRVLLPRRRATGQWGTYALALAATMVVLTALALAVIRVSYLRAFGPDPDPNGVYKHFAIDLFGMAVHLVGAAVVVAVDRRLTGARGIERT
jgi:hypothetical protein